MFSKTQLARKYIDYWWHASNGKGHGVHSPFVFDFIVHVLDDKKEYFPYFKIEQLRKELKKDEELLTIEDMGAGSRVDTHTTRTVANIAATALKPTKYAQLLFRIVHYYQPQTIVELGTSLGLTSSYLASGSPLGRVFTFEGAPTVAAVALKNFKKLGIENIRLSEGNFDQTLPRFLQSEFAREKRLDFAFIDGNHREEPTVRYFRELLPYVQDHSILVFDDIHWSAEMEAAWKTIVADEKVTLTIDLFFVGLVFFRKENREKEHFIIRY